jgi:hypothetical protein
MFSLAVAGRINFSKRSLLLIHPTIRTIDMILNVLYPFPQDNYILLNLYVISYIVYGFYVLIKLLYTAKRQGAKQLLSNYVLLLVGTSPMGFQLFSVYIARLFNLKEAFKSNIIFLILLTPFLIYTAYSSGLFNARLNIDN